MQFHLGRVPAGLKIRYVQLDNGTKLDSNYTVVGIGVRPNIAMAEEAGIATDKSCSRQSVFGDQRAWDFASDLWHVGPIRAQDISGWNIGSWRSATAVRPRE